MPLYKGNTKIGAIYKGTTPISAIYKGSTLIFSSYTWQEWYVEYIYNILVPTTINSKNVLNKAKVSTIYGNSVVENQHFNSFRTVTVNGCSITPLANGKGFHIQGTAQATANTWVVNLGSDYSRFANHKMLIINKTNIVVRNNGFGRNKTEVGQITAQYFVVDMVANTVYDDDVELQLIDLTQMFPFNTPTTLTDIRVQAILNRGYIPYNTGTLKNVDMSEISTTKSDATQLATLSLKYQGSGVNTSHDTMVIDNDNVVFTKNMNRVDLGSLTFAKVQTTNGYCFYGGLSDSYRPTSVSVIANLLCPIYQPVSYGNVYQNLTDKSIARQSDGQNIVVYDSSYQNASATDFKTAMSGVMLEYQLATPQVITIPRKHIGVIDLGSLNWEALGSSRFVSRTIESVIKPVATTSTQAHIYCSIYQTTSYANLNNDFAIAVYTNGRLYIKDTSKETLTGEQFKNSLSGQYLYYETTDESTIPNIIGVQGGGTITTNSEVLPNVDFEVKAK